MNFIGKKFDYLVKFIKCVDPENYPDSIFKVVGESHINANSWQEAADLITRLPLYATCDSIELWKRMDHLHFGEPDNASDFDKIQTRKRGDLNGVDK